MKSAKQHLKELGINPEARTAYNLQGEKISRKDAHRIVGEEGGVVIVTVDETNIQYMPQPGSPDGRKRAEKYPHE